jgi:N utilization substance protein B
MSRIKAREVVLGLVFEKDYHKDIICEKLYSDMIENGQAEEIYNYSNEKNEKNEKNGDGFSNKEEDFKNNKNIKLTDDDAVYIKDVFLGVFENVDRLDNLISESSVGWERNRISKISMALLRIAVYEALYSGDIPVAASINEAIELSKKYDHAEAYTFIHGVLSSVMKNIGKGKSR